MKTLSESILKSVKAGKHSIDNIIQMHEFDVNHVKRNHISLDYLKDVLAKVIKSNPKIVKAKLYFNIGFFRPQMGWLLYTDDAKLPVCELEYEPEIKYDNGWSVKSKTVFPGDPEYKIVEKIKKDLKKIKK